MVDKRISKLTWEIVTSAHVKVQCSVRNHRARLTAYKGVKVHRDASRLHVNEIKQFASEFRTLSGRPISLFTSKRHYLNPPD